MLKIFIILLSFTLLILFISCSGSVNNSQNVFPHRYLSPDYEDKSFSDVKMDICMPNTKYEYNRGLDSNLVSNLINFNESFLKYFPEGIKMFSSITEVGWIFYDYDSDTTLIEYSAKRKDFGEYFVILSDSLSYFQRQSNSDFLFVIHNITTIGNPLKKNDKNSNKVKDYETIISGQYSIWNTKNSDLVAQDTVKTKMKFKKLIDKWPYRGAVSKLAYDIFKKLPMFKK